MAVLTAGILFILFLLFMPFGLRVKAKIRSRGVYIKLLFITVRAEYRPPFGFVLLFGKNRCAVIGEKKSPQSAELINAIGFERLTVTGEVGIRDMPDKTVIASGVFNTILIQASLLFLKTAPKVNISPCFTGNAFSINIDCIARVVLGKILIEAIKLKRRRINESSNRKYNAVVDGTHKASRGRKYRYRYSDNG